jgi:hypothetical protein
VRPTKDPLSYSVKSAASRDSLSTNVWLALAPIGVVLLYMLATTPAWQDRIGAAATALVRPAIIPMVELVNTGPFVYLTSAFIFLSAVVLCWVYWVRAVSPRLTHFSHLRSSISELALPGKSSTEWPVAQLALSNVLVQSGLFPASFAAFQCDSAEAKGVVATPFSVYVARDRDGVGSRHDGLMQALPGYYTSLGLILTFIGLVVALYFAARGFRAGDMVSARAAIVQLLNAASFKFLTSVAALISALLVSLFARFARARLLLDTNAALAAVDNYLAVWRTVAPAHVSRDGDVVERLDQLIRSIERLEATLANAVCNRISEAKRHEQ